MSFSPRPLFNLLPRPSTEAEADAFYLSRMSWLAYEPSWLAQGLNSPTPLHNWWMADLVVIHLSGRPITMRLIAGSYRYVSMAHLSTIKARTTAPKSLRTFALSLFYSSYSSAHQPFQSFLMGPPTTAPFNPQDPATFTGAINAANYLSIPDNLKSHINPLIEAHHTRVAPSLSPEDPALAEVHSAFTKACGTMASLLSIKMTHSVIAQAMATELENIDKMPGGIKAALKFADKPSNEREVVYVLQDSCRFFGTSGDAMKNLNSVLSSYALERREQQHELNAARVKAKTRMRVLPKSNRYVSDEQDTEPIGCFSCFPSDHVFKPCPTQVPQGSTLSDPGSSAANPLNLDEQVKVVPGYNNPTRDAEIAKTDHIAFNAHNAVRNSHLTILLLEGMSQHQAYLMAEIQAISLVIKTNLNLRKMYIDKFDLITAQLENPSATDRNGDPLLSNEASDATVPEGGVSGPAPMDED
ncbi:hypothetical protein C8J56DRAFT_1045640 [Mycena floridula]|nr:hypothetical protein C8J56DRAFT_1045640 [Mycena floridula]